MCPRCRPRPCTPPAAPRPAPAAPYLWPNRAPREQYTRLRSVFLFPIRRGGGVCMDLAAKGWICPPASAMHPPQPRAVPQFPRARSPGGEWGGDGQSIPGGGGAPHTPMSPSQGTSRTASPPPASLCQLLNPRGVILGWGHTLEGRTSSGPQGAVWGCSVAVGALCVPPRGLHEAPLSVPRGSGVPPGPRLQPLCSATTGAQGKGSSPPLLDPSPVAPVLPAPSRKSFPKGQGLPPSQGDAPCGPLLHLPPPLVVPPSLVVPAPIFGVQSPASPQGTAAAARRQSIPSSRRPEQRPG